MRKPETLAPAGSMETLSAALRTGADAVYVGGKRFSARSSASNFSDEELAQAAALCHRYGAKLYLAVNTIISDSESQDFCNYIKYTSSIGVDAYIVQDFGCAEIIKKSRSRCCTSRIHTDVRTYCCRCGNALGIRMGKSCPCKRT